MASHLFICLHVCMQGKFVERFVFGEKIIFSRTMKIRHKLDNVCYNKSKH